VSDNLNLIQVKDVTKKYRLGSNEVEVLHGINLEIKDGNSSPLWANRVLEKPLS